MQEHHLVVECGREDGAEDRLARRDRGRRDPVVAETCHPIANLGGKDVDHPDGAKFRNQGRCTSVGRRCRSACTNDPSICPNSALLVCCCTARNELTLRDTGWHEIPVLYREFRAQRPEVATVNSN